MIKIIISCSLKINHFEEGSCVKTCFKEPQFNVLNSRGLKQVLTSQIL